MLEYEADTSALNGQVGRIFARQLHRSGIGRLQAGDDPEQGALARAGGTEQGHEFSGRDRERHMVNGLK